MLKLIFGAIVKMDSRIVICFSILISCAIGTPVFKKSTYTFPFYSRNDWGAAPPVGSEPLNTPVPYVVVHHTYIPSACFSSKECSKSMRSMQNYHNSLDWGDIGYNFCVGSEGGAYEGRGWKTLGIHTGKANSYSIGICLIGDWRTTLPPSEQLATTKALIAAGVQQGFISPDYKLIAHKQVSATECPGTALFDEISKWKHFSQNGFEMSVSNKVTPNPA